MEQTLFIGNLSWDTTDESLTSFISEFDINTLDVSVQFQSTGRSKGWALVTVEDGKAAVDQLNEQQLDGRTLVVRVDRKQTKPQDRRTNQERAPRRGGGDNDVSVDSKSLYVGNLSWNVRSEELSEYLGIPAEVTMGFDGRSRGYGIATCQSVEEAKEIISEFNNVDFDGRQLVVKVNRPRGGAAPRRGGAAPQQNSAAPRRGNNGSVDPKSLYIGNLSWSVTSEELTEYLGLPAEIVMGFDGRSRGYGICNCNSAEQAQEIINQNNGEEFAGRAIVLKLNRN